MVNEEIMIFGICELISAEVGKGFSSEERQEILQYLTDHPNANPQEILQYIMAITRRKLERIGQQLSSEKEERIKKNHEILALLEKAIAFMLRKKLNVLHNKNTASITANALNTGKTKITNQKNANEKLTDVEKKRLIEEAEKKLFDKKKGSKKKLNDKERQKAKEYFINALKEENSSDHVTLANAALLSVLKAVFGGGIRIVVQQNWGNPLVPDVNPLHGEAPIDQPNRDRRQSSVHNLTNDRDAMSALANGISRVIQHNDLVSDLAILVQSLEHGLKAPLPSSVSTLDDIQKILKENAGSMAQQGDAETSAKSKNSHIPTLTPYHNPLHPFEE